MERIRVVLVDDHAIVRAGILAVLATAADIEVVGEAANGIEAMELVSRLGPAVVVMDLEMQGGDGETATRAISALPRGPRVLVLSYHDEEERLVPMLRAGAGGYLSKAAVGADLADAIRTVAAGDIYVRPRVARLLASELQEHVGAPRDPCRARFDQLSDREREVVRLIAAGYNGPEIGTRLGISAKTVDTYKQRIEEKLGLRHRTEYVRFGLQLGLITPG
jgi:DNA-binding NarL/FixJ family response regulator